MMIIARAFDGKKCGFGASGATLVLVLDLSALWLLYSYKYVEASLYGEASFSSSR